MPLGNRIAIAAAAATLLLQTPLANAQANATQNRALATFPAQQRPPGDPTVVARGKSLYAVNCQACHGVDLRGGDLGGPNLLRSQVVLSDQNGELIAPILQGSRQANGMPAIPMNAPDLKATATFIHNVVGTSRGQGAPPETGIPAPNVLVGTATAGAKFFAAKCTACHSATGDLQGIATKAGDPKALQNRWVSGGNGRGATNPARRIVTVSVMQPSGEKIEGRLVRIDDFLVTLSKDDGALQTFRRDGDTPKVEVKDPMQTHRDLLSTYSDKDMHDVTAYLVTLK